MAAPAAVALVLAFSAPAQAAAPPNDDFGDATEVAGLPFSDDVALAEATLEPGEPGGCFFLTGSAWYAYTPTASGWLEASLAGSGAWDASVTVWRSFGPGLGGLSLQACAAAYWSPPSTTFRAEAGVTYYLQAGSGSGGTARLLLESVPAPAPVAGFSFTPSSPTTFDTLSFWDFSWDPAGVGIELRTWTFGDGTTASGCCPSHRYSRDGSYEVQLTVTTFDGRVATATQSVRVETHDVAIVKLQAPNTASSGQTKQVTVELRSALYPEQVQLHLYKSVPGFGGLQWIGTQLISVPVRTGNRTTSIAFSYTFTADDATMGKVTFKAVAALVGAQDALPADNEAISSPTKVSR